MPHSTDAIFNSFTAFAKLCIDKKEVPYFLYDPAKIDSFFYEIKQKYPKEFERVIFDINGHRPVSKIVNQAKNDMFLCGNLFSLSPRFNPHLVSKDILIYLEKVENKKVYIGVAEKFYKEFGCDIRGNLEQRTSFESLEKLN